MTRPIVVFDLGKTSLKLLVVSADGEVIESTTAPNRPIEGEPYRHADAAAIEAFLIAGLRELAGRHTIAAVVTTTHGASAALVDGQGLVLPIMDYEAQPPAAIDAEYDRLAPSFAETGTPLLPASLNLGRQLLWQSRAFPRDVARARFLLTYPQYWAWRLSGVAAAEVTSLGCHGHLWNPRTHRVSALIDALDIGRLLPPLLPAWTALGTVTPEIARATGLPADCKVISGVHDSNAAYLRYLHFVGGRFSVASTGTWVICFNRGGRVEQLDPARDTLTNIDVHGDPVCCSRFMGGREFAAILGDTPAATPASEAALTAMVACGAMALPAFSESGGPFPGARGEIVGAIADDGERVALATLYLALMTEAGLEAIEAGDDLVVDGAFVANPMFAPLLAALRPSRRVRVAGDAHGTALGAALLARWGEPMPKAAPALRPVAPAIVPGLADYARDWRRRAEARARIGGR